MPKTKMNGNGGAHSHGTRGRPRNADCRIATKLCEYWLAREGLPGLEEADEKFAALATAIDESPDEIRRFIGRHSVGYLKRLTGAKSATVQLSWIS